MSSRQLLSVLVIFALVAGCASGPHLPDGIPPPQPSASDDPTYCQAMEVNSRRYARRQTGIGWTLGVLSAAAIGAGAVMVGTASSPGRGERIVSLSLPAAGALLGYGASASFKRAEQHGALASAAVLAMNEPNSTVLCNEALATWNTGRADANASMIAATQAKVIAKDAKVKAEAADKTAKAAAAKK